MPRYRRIRLGSLKNSFHEQCLEGSFAGLDYGFNEDLSGKFTPHWKEFNAWFIPHYQENIEQKSKTSLGLAGGALWTFCYEMQIGDYILSPDHNGHFHVGRVNGDYFYDQEGPLPHRREINWTGQVIDKESFSEQFLASVKGPLSNVDIDKYADEIESLLEGEQSTKISVADTDVEDPVVFALEIHLEEFLLKNWESTEFGKNYDLLEEEGELVAQQFPTDTGPIDILAISKDKKELLVIELKKGKASDVVVGQIQRYMGYVIDDIAEENQIVKGAIVALEDDLRLRRALSVANDIEFFKYKVDFELFKVV